MSATAATHVVMRSTWEPRHLAFLILVQCLWGFNWVALKEGLAEFPPLLMMAIRFLCTFVILVPFLRWPGGSVRAMVAGAVVTGPIHFALMFVGMAYAKDIAPLAVATNLSIPFATVLAAIFLKDKIGIWRGSALALSFGGVMLVGFDPRVLEYALALVLVVGGALAWSIGAIILRGVKTAGAFDMQAWVAMIAWPPLLAASVAFEGDTIAIVSHASWRGWLSVAYVVLAATVVAHAGFYYLLRRYPIPLMAPYLLIAPILGVFLGVVWFGDVLTWRMVVGGIITLTGVLIITIREGARQPA